MSALLSYLESLAPIPAGIVMFIIIKSLRLSGRRIRIIEGEQTEELRHGGGMERPLAVKIRTQMREKRANHPRYEAFVRDVLIINGKLSARYKSGAALFAGTGVISVGEVCMLPEYIAKTRKDRIWVFLERREGMLPELLRYGRSSGILISYSMDSKLGFVGER